jgi:hypothetical protein
MDHAAENLGNIRRIALIALCYFKKKKKKNTGIGADRKRASTGEY